MLYSIFYSSLIHLPSLFTVISFLPFPFFHFYLSYFLPFYFRTFLYSYFSFTLFPFVLTLLYSHFPSFSFFFILIFLHSYSLYYFITNSCFISLVFLFSCDISRKATPTSILRDNWTNVYRTVCRRTYSTENCHAMRCSVRLTLPSLHNLSFSFIN